MSKIIKSHIQTLVLIILPICSSLCIDMYLPAYGSISTGFHVHIGLMDLTMSIYLIGLSFGQLIYGVLSDRFGRKITLVPGLVLFCIASFICAFSLNFSSFLIGRLLQAIGACAATVICRAIVADSYIGKKRTQILALISASNIFSPALAPLYGGLMVTYYNWRMIFIFIGIFSIFMIILTQWLIKETLPKPNHDALNPSVLKFNFYRLFHHRLFRTYIMILGLLFLIGYAWVLLSPSVLMGYFHVSPEHFGTYYLLPGLGSCFGALIVAKFSPYFSAQKSIRVGLAVILVASFFLIIVKDFVNTPLYFMLFIMAIFFMNGFINPQIISEALGQFLDIGGFASSIIGFFQTFLGALLGCVATYVYAYGVEAIGGLMVVPAIIALALFLIGTFVPANRQAI